jgi:hypothetical protein
VPGVEVQDVGHELVLGLLDDALFGALLEQNLDFLDRHHRMSSRTPRSGGSGRRGVVGLCPWPVAKVSHVSSRSREGGRSEEIEY